MPKKIDLTNKNFGEWTVIREATKEEKSNRPGAYWLCQCSCGTQKIINGQLLRQGESKSCGCKTIKYIKEANQKRATDMTGQKYNKLTVLERDFEYEKHLSSKKSQTYWKCQCECGNITTVGRNDLITEKVKSCGCLRKKIAAKNLSEISSNIFIDETNNRYGKLTVLYKIKNTVPNRKGVLWHCKCDCGNEKDVFGIDLRNGTVSSCGCMGKSKGEYLIEQLLIQANIVFNKEYPLTILDKILRFDFAIYKNNQLFYLIEFDGEQHYKSITYFGGDKYFLQLQQNDKIKNQWCKENNISLIRIPYTHLNDLCLEDLLLETSKFIIK